jgi:hypothetical protein
MHGPYTAKVTIPTDGVSVEFELTPDDLRIGDRIAGRYSQGAGIELALGATRAASMFVARMLDDGETAEVEIVGFEGTGTARSCVWRRDTVRRDDRGRAFLSLGSRFGERYFRGL